MASDPRCILVLSLSLASNYGNGIGGNDDGCRVVAAVSPAGPEMPRHGGARPLAFLP